MTLATLRLRAKADYGLQYSSTEDPIFGVPRMNAWVNEAHQQLAEACKLYRETITTNLPIASGGVSTVSIDTDAIEVDAEKVLVLDGSTWIQVDLADEDIHRRVTGPMENSSTTTIPTQFWFRTSNTASSHRQLVFWPGATAAITNGLKYDAWVLPSDLSSDSSEPVFAPSALRVHLIPLVCLKMAIHEAGMGRSDAPVSLWEMKSREAIQAVKENHERFRSPGARSAHLRAIDFL